MPPPLPVDAVKPAPGFGNQPAVRSGLMAAVVATALLFVPLPPLLQPFWLVVLLPSAGFLSVYLYQRRTGEFLTPIGGLRVGWLAGVFSFVLLFALVTITIAIVMGNENVSRMVADMAQAAGQRDPVANLRELPSGAMGVFVLTMGTVFMFVLTTGMAAIGGALGALVLDRER